MESDHIELRRKRDFGGTINVVFEFVRKNWRQIGRSLMFIVGPVLLIASVVSGFYLQGLLDVFGDLQDTYPSDSLSMFNDIWPLVMLSSIAGIVSTVFLFAALAGYVRLYVNHPLEPIEVDDVWSEVKSSFLRVTGTMIAAIVIVMLPMLVLALPALVFEEPVLLTLLIFAVVPMVYLYNCFSIIIPMRLEEDIGIFDAIRRCMYLMKGRWWFSFWISFVMVMIVSIASMVFQIPVQVAMAMTTLTGFESSGWILFLSMAVSTIGSYLLYSLLIIAFSVLYYNLVEHKEGIGMAERISEIGAGLDGGAGTVSGSDSRRSVGGATAL